MKKSEKIFQDSQRKVEASKSIVSESDKGLCDGVEMEKIFII